MHRWLLALLMFVPLLAVAAGADTPRADNLSDLEVREIEAVAKASLPSATLVSIGAVSELCPCDSVAGCNAQVTVHLLQKGKTRSLQLSRFKDGWQLGPLQQWQLRLQALDAQREDRLRTAPGERRRIDREYWQQQEALMRQRPICATDIRSPR